jgi:hypothetical protein
LDCARTQNTAEHKKMLSHGKVRASFQQIKSIAAGIFHL